LALSGQKYYVIDKAKAKLKSFEVRVQKEKFIKSEERKMKHNGEYNTQDKLYISKIASQIASQVVNKAQIKEQKPDLINLRFVHDYHVYVSALANYFFDVAFRYINPHRQGKIKSRYGFPIIIKPVVFVEGEYDVIYIKRAAELLEYTDLLQQVEIRQRGGYKNLDKLWDIYNEDSWEPIPQKNFFFMIVIQTRKRKK
jgi:hypothetical protein